jgi:arginyl-tRNA synthetase
MILAGVVGRPPRDVAQELADDLTARLGSRLERVEIAGPGFLNLFLSDEWHLDALAAVLEVGAAWGGGGATTPERVNVEFVSANPTGPLHVGHARNAAYGDALARILAFHGHAVEREYYVNDYGSQIGNLGRSIQARARGEEPPEDGYVGDYVVKLAAEIEDAGTRPVDEVAQAGVALMLERLRASLATFRVEFDTWFSERSLHTAQEGAQSAVDHAFAELAERGRTYRHEDALWLRTTEFGDDKDRVLVRSSGEHTYFASDIAYHESKRSRGFDRLVYVLGADHHGYVQRMKAAFANFGGDPDRLELVIMQFVHLVRAGEQVSMSKRSGEFVTLDDLVQDVGVDAARWFVLNRSHDTTIEFDLDLAREQSAENPVYYVQYAHARCASILRRWRSEGDVVAAVAHISEPLHPSERGLVHRLAAFPDEVAEAVERRAPHRIATYALELAQTFTAFYRDCQVLDLPNHRTQVRRIELCEASAATIATALDLLGVEAPQEMHRDEPAG